MNKIVISERFLSYLIARVGKVSPKLRMIARGSPKLCRFLPTTSATNKKSSPKCSGVKKSGGSPKGIVFNVSSCFLTNFLLLMLSCKFSIVFVVKKMADWNPDLEKSLVDILHEYKDSGYRSDNGWNSEGWNRMVKEFHIRNKYVSYTKAQIQDKEG